MSTEKVKANTEKKAETKTTETQAKTTKAKTTETTSKASLIANLRTILPSVVKVDTDLAAKIDKALTSKKTTVDTLNNLLQQATALGNKKPVAENEEKKSPEKSGEDKKSTKKTIKAKKNTEKKSEDKSPVKSEKTVGDIKAPVATLFPDTLTTSFEGADITMTKAKDTEFLTVEDIVTAMNEGKIVVLACYWTKRHIKEFNYEFTFRVAAPKSFKDDLDLCLAVVDCPNAKRLWVMSMETEAMLYFEEEELTPVEDTNPYNGEKYNIRVSNGMEYAIYVADAPTEETPAEESTKD